MVSKRMQLIVGGLMALAEGSHGVDEIAFMVVHELPELFSRSATDVLISRAGDELDGLDVKENVRKIEETLGKDWGLIMCSIQLGELLTQIRNGEKDKAAFFAFCMKHGVLEDDINHYLGKK